MTIYYRTGKGSHRHTDFYCANTRRSLFTGDVTVIPTDEVAGWAPCDVCCGADEVAAHAATVAAAQDEMCRNSGVTNPRRMRSTCRDCGKEGAVNRSTGKIKAHRR